MSTLIPQSVVMISADLGICMVILYNLKKAWMLQREMERASEKDVSAGSPPISSRWFRKTLI